MLEAIGSLSSQGGLLKNFVQKKSTAHWILQVTAATLIAVGFTVIVIVKFKNGKPHFSTWHAFLGLIAILSATGSNIGGTATLYSKKFKSFMTPAQFKIVHSSLGLVTLTLGLVTLSLGFFTSWFTRNANEMLAWLYTLLIFVIGIRVLNQSFKSILSRLKSNK
jgi:uncharacterized membrane protein YbjE (DUF340 family)